VDARIFGGPALRGTTSYQRLPLRGGLSAPVVGSRDLPAAVRVSTPSGRSTEVLLPGALEPVTPRVRVGTATGRWRGLAHEADRAALADDIVFAAQLCAGAPTAVEPVWAGGAPGFAQIRLEQVRCSGRLSLAQFVTGAGDHWHLLAAQTVRGDVYAADLYPEPDGIPSVLLVGSTRVAAVAAGSFRIPGRVAVLPLRVAFHVRVTDAAGRTIRWP
jgi:hypothetical protein